MSLKIIAFMARTSHNTVKKYINTWHFLKKSFDDFQSKSDTELHSLFYFTDVPSAPNPLEALHPEISKDLNRKV